MENGEGFSITRPDLSIVIVSWNARSHLVNCLKSIEDTGSGLAYEVIVVDNASSDGSPEAVRQGGFRNVRLVETDANLGFAKGNNIGIKLGSGRYYCLINSDVVVLPGCLREMLSFMETDPAIGLAGPRLLNGNGNYQTSCREMPRLGNQLARALFINTSLADRNYKSDSSAEVELLAGSFWVARREAVAQVGLLDERFFFYAEDIDWCKRFHQAGWSVCFHPHARAVHFGNASSDTAPDRFNLELQRASLQLWQKYNGRLGTAAYLLICILRHVLRAGHCELRAWFDVPRKRQWRDKLEQHLASLQWLGRAILGRGEAMQRIPQPPTSPSPKERRRMPQLAADSRRPFRIGFVGDLMLGGHFLDYARQRRLDPLEPFRHVIPLLNELDLLLVNLEGPIVNGDEAPAQKSAILSSHASVVDLFKKVPACVCSLANNHIMDYGVRGLRQTQDILRANGIHFNGAGQDASEAEREVLLCCNGWRVACLAFTTDEPDVGSTISSQTIAGCASWARLEALKRRLKQLRRENDVVIVSLHWGREYFEYPSDSQVTLARILIEAGANFVVGHHPHLVQGSEHYQGGHIFYSLGHLFLPPFRMRDGRTRYLKAKSQEFALARCTIEEELAPQVEVIGGRWGNGYVLKPYLGSARRRFETKLQRLSHPLGQTGYEAFWASYAEKRPKLLRITRPLNRLAAWKQGLAPI